MISALLIAFREGLEAALIVGIVLSYLKKSGHTQLNRQAWLGVATAIGLSVVIALGILAIGAELEGEAEPIFEGTTMLLAVVVLTWMIFWMRTQARSLKSTLEQEINQAVHSRQAWGVALLTFLAVFREGIETTLFLAANALSSNNVATLIGSFTGLTAAVMLGYLIYRSSVHLNLKKFFDVTSIILLVFAAGMAAHAIHEFEEVGLIPAIKENLWNLNPLIHQESTLGQVLQNLVGYNAKPTLIEIVTYLGYWGVTLVGVRWWISQVALRRQRA